MKAITLWQPWASAMYYRWKRNETRGWYTAYRGPLVIHAAKAKRVRLPDGTRLDLEEFFERPEIKSCFVGVGIQRFDQLPFGCGLLQCRLVACLPTERFIESGTQESRKENRELGRLEKMWGDYSPGWFAWVTEDALNFAEPIPATGAQCIWNWAREAEPILL